MKNTATTKVIKGIAEMRRFSLEARKRGAKVALVPTMGALHEGHLALVGAARQKADTVVVSIFVNPLQFGPREDLSGYPRDLAGDVAKLQQLGVAAVFTPEAVEMYPPGHRTHVEVDDLSQRLCGRARPTHFRGVATVVTKLFAIVQPHQAWFGQKDYQQLLILRKMVRDLNFDIEIFDIPTVREADGLARSSRNAYLTSEQRPAALTLQQALHVAARIMAKGERSAAKIASNLREVIRAQPGAEIEYISICHPETLHELDTVEVRTLVALAVRVGRARLIDNTIFDLRELSQRADLKKPAKPVVAAKAVPSPREGDAAKPAIKAAAKPAVKPVAKVAAKPAAKTVAKPASKPAAKPAAKPMAKPAGKTVAKVAARPAVKNDGKSAAPPVAKTRPTAGKKAARR
jgi:pantoate--beta-alanine ligase